MNISAKILNSSLNLLYESGNFHLAPQLIASTLGINALAIGMVDGRQYLVHLASTNGLEIEPGHVAADQISCLEMDFIQEGNQCHFKDCPLRQRLLDRYEMTEQPVTCLPISDRKAFLMISHELPPASMELLRTIANIIGDCLSDVNNFSKRGLGGVLPADVAQMWSEMLAGLSHDLRTPLACIKGYATTLLREDVSWNQSDQRDFLNIIVEETDHIENLISQLLDSSTLGWKGEIELKKELVALPQIINRVIKDPSYRVKQHIINVVFPENFPLVNADPIRIEQVVRNLISNAIKYSPENTYILIQGESKYGEIIVSVTDHGIGISDEHQNRLFEKFFRVNNNADEHQKGMGLGLPLARQILVSHGGKIWAKSKLNEGTTFYFSLPWDNGE